MRNQQKHPSNLSIARAKARAADIQEEDIQAALLLMDVASKMSVAKEALYARHGLTAGRFEILRRLKEEPGCALTPSDLARITGVCKTTMTQFVDTLERDGHVRREDNPADRRAKRVVLTRSGRAVVGKILPDHFERLANFARALTAAERKELCAILSKLQDSLLNSLERK